MPKQVDHEAKRREILETTWRLIADRGADAATMREIARQAGYANGALAYYFANKDALIEAAYGYVFDRTNDRIRQATAGLRGLAAVRAFLVEVLPTTELTLLEARIVLPFWSRTIADQQFGQLHDQALQRWRSELRALVRQAREDGDITTAEADHLVVERALAMAMGLQVLATTPETPTPATTQRAMLDAFLAGLSTD